MKSLIIIKLGGSIITDKKSEIPKVDYANLEKFSAEIAKGYNPKEMRLILVHGAGSYGHSIAKRTGLHLGIVKDEQLVDFAEVQRLQNELNCIATQHLIKHGLPAIPCQASSFIILNAGRIVKGDITAIENLVNIGMIPVLYGVPAYDEKQKCAVLSGDQIAPYLAKKLNAEKIIHITNVNGIYDKDPNKFNDAKHITEINSQNFEEVKKALTGSLDTDVSGGMLTKVSELMNIGVKSQIISGLISENIVNAMKGNNVGTIITG
ncbi:MAG: isopentenyl phosphate kinase family protein [Nanoarchaeota archaeon]|nr:isopentenyl phosphate kinase family protein [Nanoarchaeota archaeon]